MPASGPPARSTLEGDVAEVASGLLGATLISAKPTGTVRVRITEVEAYGGLADPASHAFRGLTARTAVMFGPAGYLYCYFVYGMHWCANIVTGADGDASAVLLRAGEVLEGEDVVRARAGRTALRPALLASGPARLARALGLGGIDTGTDLLDLASDVRVDSVTATADFCSGPRVGISVATDVPWRFWLPDEPSVSAFRAGGRPRGRRQPAD